MSTILSGTEAGQAGSPPPAADNPALAAGAGGASGGAWYESLSGDVKDHPTIKQFKSVDDLAKSWMHSQSLIGKKGVVPPGEKSSPEEWKRFYKDIGQPELEKYDLKGEKIDPNSLKAFKQAAHEAGLLPKQAQALLEWQLKQQEESMSAQQLQKKQQEEEGLASLKKEWGEGFDKEVNYAIQAVKEVGGNEFQEYLTKTGLGNDPTLIKIMSKVGKLIGEDTIRGEGKSSLGKTPAEIDAEIANIMGNPQHPYFDNTHPGHKAALDMVGNLFKRKK